MTGAAVRLSASGLGCPDWPACTSGSLVAARTRGDPILHTYIEFTNRMLTFALMVVAVLVMVTAWRYRPAGTRRRALVIGVGRPSAPTSTKSSTPWSSGLRPVAIVVHTIGERRGS